MSERPGTRLDPPVVVEPPEAADATVIWLHGLGADGHDFEPIVGELRASLRRCTRFVFPHAPERAVTINAGMRMRAWYDISETDLSRRADESGVRDSARILEAMIAEQADAGIPAGRVVLAGFSQGGAIALHTGLRHARALAGIMALSTYLPLEHALAGESSEANRHIPVFMAHGSQDPVIPLGLSERSRALLCELGYVVETHTYPMPHSVCAEEIRDISDWLERVLTRPAPR